MKDNFERGKQLLIEGFEDFLKLYQPYIKVFQGLKMVGLTRLLDSKGELASTDFGLLLKLGLDTFITGLRDADSAEAIEEVIKDNVRFFQLIAPRGNK